MPDDPGRCLNCNQLYPGHLSDCPLESYMIKPPPERKPDNGRKSDGGKAPMELLPMAALESAARVLGFGREKYGAWNWANGIAYGRVAAAAVRHLYAFLDGEDDDKESGLPHVDHALCCLMFLSHYVHHPELYAQAHDDRRGSDK